MTTLTELATFKQGWYLTASADEQEQFRTWLLGILRTTDSVTVTFTKKDGTLRTMTCTLKDGIAPVVESPSTSSTLCTVWDTVMVGWRSFKFENIQSIDFSL